MKVKHSGQNYVKFYGGLIAENAARRVRNGGSPISAVVCPECGCEYEHTPEDVQSQAYIGAADDAIKTGTYGYIHYVCCPECGKRYPCGSTLKRDFPTIFGEKFVEEHRDCMTRCWDGQTYGCVNWDDEE